MVSFYNYIVNDLTQEMATNYDSLAYYVTRLLSYIGVEYIIQYTIQVQTRVSLTHLAQGLVKLYTGPAETRRTWYSDGKVTYWATLNLSPKAFIVDRF